VDYVQVKNWGSGQPQDLGSLQLAAQPQVLNTDASFYEVLARHLETLQAEGALSVARPRSAPPIPPFQHWAFAESHYQQHLADLLIVHSTIEDSYGIVLRELVHSDISGTVAARMVEALSLLGPDAGLHRSEQIVTDLTTMIATSAYRESDGTVNSFSSRLEAVPSPNAASYAQYIKDIAVQCGRAESEAELCNRASR